MGLSSRCSSCMLSWRTDRRPGKPSAQGRPQPAPVPALRSQRQVFGDRHVGRGTGKGILKHPADQRCPPMLRPARDVSPRQANRTPVDEYAAGHRIQQSRLAGTVRANNDRERPFFDRAVDTQKGAHFVGSSRKECLLDAAQFEHEFIQKTWQAFSQPYWVFNLIRLSVFATYGAGPAIPGLRTQTEPLPA